MGFVRESDGAKGFVALWKPLMGLSGKDFVGLLAGGEGMLSAVEFCICGAIELWEDRRVT